VSVDPSQINGTGRLQIDNATDATTTTDGSLQTDGGLSVAKKIYAGEDISIRGYTARSQSWSPAGAGSTDAYDTNGYSTVLVTSPSAASHTLNGISSTGLVAGRRVLFIVVGVGASSIVIANEAGSAAAANKITTGTGGNVTITADGCFEVVFTGTRWWLANYIS
jgi:hypothetical protein